MLGVSLALMGRPVEGILTGALSLAGILALLVYWWDTRPRTTDDVEADDDETVLWRPYRTASARFSQKFLTHLAAVEAELQRTATEEGWSIDRSRHESAFNAAKSALSGKQYRQAFRHYAQAIDVLMQGVQLQRKQMQREAKWGRNSESAPQNAGG